MSRRAWVAFAAISLIWGIPYLFIAVALRGGMTPYSLAFARVALAAVALLIAAWRGGVLAQLKGRWAWLAAYAVVEVCVPFPLIAVGEQHVASSVAAITIAAVPLIVAIVALRFDPSERPTRSRALGLIVGFAGVIALVGVELAGRADELLGIGALGVAAVGYALGPMIIKHRLGNLDARAAMGGSLAIAAAVLAPAAALQWPGRSPTAGALVSLVILGFVCTAAAFLVFTVLIREAGTARASVITYVNPVIALGLGVTVLGERPRPGALAGLLLILGGSWLATGGGVAARLSPGVLFRTARSSRRPASPRRSRSG